MRVNTSPHGFRGHAKPSTFRTAAKPLSRRQTRRRSSRPNRSPKAWDETGFRYFGHSLRSSASTLRGDN